MFFIDSHTHFYDKAFGGPEGEDDTVRRAIENGVGKMIVPDENSLSRDSVFSLCSRWPGTLFPCAGIHPTEIGPEPEKEVERLESFLRGKFENNPDGESLLPVAVGECGMDLYWTKENIDTQRFIFRAQLDLALEFKLPVIVHARDAIQPIFEILEDYKGRGLRGVFHAWSGSIESFRRLERYGDWRVGIGGVLTYKKASVAETVKDIPLERILLETDSPYLTPVPHRGKRNESSYIPIIAAFLAEKKGVSLEDVATVTTSNAETLFVLNN